VFGLDRVCFPGFLIQTITEGQTRCLWQYLSIIRLQF